MQTDGPKTIVHVSDLHLEPRGAEQYPGLFDRIERIGEHVQRIGADLVIATGDLTNRGSSAPEHFDLARTWLESLRTPYLAVPGNHDLGANALRGELYPQLERYESCRYQDTGYAATFGPNPISKRLVGDLVVFGIALRENDPDGAVGLLEEALTETHGPVAIAGHYPIIPTRPLNTRDAFGAYGYVESTAKQLREVIRAHEQVIAYLCGHVHLTSMRPLSAHCMQFTAGAAGPGAAALRIYQWDGVSWIYSTEDLEGPNEFWENHLAEARADPNFSTGEPTERNGTWLPASTNSK